MPRMRFLFTFIFVLPLVPELANAEFLNITEAPFAAVGDGTTDDRPALVRAFAKANAGDTILFPPGDYRMNLTGGALKIPQGVTLWGQSGKSRLSLGTTGKSGEYREFLRPASDVTIEGLTIVRDSDFPAVLIPLSGDASKIVIRNCRVDGSKSRYPKRYCHAFRVGSGTVKDVTFDGVTIEDCSFGLFQPNSATGTLEGMTVENCRFERNTASDLEFNSPNGVMKNIVVRNCFFRDNASQSSSAGFAVGFANVTNGTVENCVIQNYGSEALHVEDRSNDIQLIGNTILGGSLLQPNGVILVVNDSRRVRIENNFVDGRLNSNRSHLILVTAGGKHFANPSDVAVIGNVLINGEQTRTWYLQNGSGPDPVGNHVIEQERKSENE